VANPQLKDPVGSDWVFLASSEVTVPVISENFAVLFFLDSGTIDTGSYRVSIGTGLQIMVPQLFGDVPMRFEIGTPLLKDDLDETQIFSFSAAGMF
jgi:outer membrane protein insertion porin family